MDKSAGSFLSKNKTPFTDSDKPFKAQMKPPLSLLNICDQNDPQWNHMKHYVMTVGNFLHWPKRQLLCMQSLRNLSLYLLNYILHGHWMHLRAGHESTRQPFGVYRSYSESKLKIYRIQLSCVGLSALYNSQGSQCRTEIMGWCCPL